MSEESEVAPSVEVSADTGEGGGGGNRNRVGVVSKVCGAPCTPCKSCVAATMAGISILANSMVSEEICGAL